MYFSKLENSQLGFLRSSLAAIRSHSKEYLQISRINGSWFGNVHHPHAEMTSLQDASWDVNKYGLWIFWAPVLKKSLL